VAIKDLATIKVETKDMETKVETKVETKLETKVETKDTVAIKDLATIKVETKVETKDIVEAKEDTKIKAETRKIETETKEITNMETRLEIKMNMAILHAQGIPEDQLVI